MKFKCTKIANIGFFAPKPYLKVVDRDFLFDRKFCLVEILKHWKRLGVKRNAFFTLVKNIRIIKTVKNGLKNCKWQNKLTKSWYSYNINYIYYIWNKLCNLKKIKKNLQFFKTVIFGYFIFFWAKKKSPKITKVVQKTAKIINFPYYLSHFTKKNHFLTLAFFLGPLTWNCPQPGKV